MRCWLLLATLGYLAVAKSAAGSNAEKSRGQGVRPRRREVSTSQTAARQLGRLFARPGEGPVQTMVARMPFGERVARISVSWLLLFWLRRYYWPRHCSTAD